LVMMLQQIKQSRSTLKFPREQSSDATTEEE
jgi:hypothetical protein